MGSYLETEGVPLKRECLYVAGNKHKKVFRKYFTFFLYFFIKKIQDMNINIELAIPLRYLPFHQCSPKWIKRPFKWPVNGKWW